MSGKKRKEPLDSVLSVLFSVALCLLILTFSIGLPIYCRPFYYAHIGPLDLAADTGYSETEIKTAFDELLDYLTLPNREFKTGIMAFSESGKAHFDDCKTLFGLNTTVFILSLVTVVTILVFKKRAQVTSLRFCRIHACTISGILSLLLPLAVGAFAFFDFERAFMVFHNVFFPHKDNWMFDPITDEIIEVLPVIFFRNCAIFIGVSIVVLSVLSIVLGLKIARKSNGCEDS